MNTIRDLERLKIIAEHNLEHAKAVSEKYPRLEEKWRNQVMKITMEIATARANEGKKKLTRRKRER